MYQQNQIPPPFLNIFFGIFCDYLQKMKGKNPKFYFRRVVVDFFLKIAIFNDDLIKCFPNARKLKPECLKT